MRPLHVLDTDGFAGTEQHVLTLATAQAGLGLRPAVACRTGTQLFGLVRASPGLSVVPLSGSLVTPAAAAALVRGVGETSADVLHAHNGRSLLASVAAGAVRRRPVVMTQHFLDPGHVGRRGAVRLLSDAAHRVCAAGTSHVIAISQAASRGVLARGEASPDRVTVVPNGIAAPDEAGLRATVDVRAEFGLSTDDPLVACAARLELEKDIATLIESMVAVRAACPTAVCVVAGEGSRRATLAAQIDRLGLSGVVRLAGFRADVLSLVRACDAFVLPSRAEPFGLVLLEAMALGKAVVACRAGGPVEIVQEGVTGLLTPPGEVQAMAGAITLLLRDAATRLKMGRHGRQAYEDRFTADRMARATTAVYEHVLSAGGASSRVPNSRVLR